MEKKHVVHLALTDVKVKRECGGVTVVLNSIVCQIFSYEPPEIVSSFCELKAGRVASLLSMKVPPDGERF